MTHKHHERRSMHENCRCVVVANPGERRDCSDIRQFSATDAIRLTAYRRWEHAGRPHGRDWEFWFAAEKEVLGAG